MKIIRNKLLWKLLAIAVGVTLVIALAAMAFGAGTTADPLVTLSYLENQFRPQVTAAVDANVATASGQLESNLNTRINSFRNSLPVSTTTTPYASAYSTVTLAPESTYTFAAGREILFLEGAATVDTAGLTNTSTGNTLAAGGALVPNQLYIAAFECTITATAELKMLVR